LKGEGDCGFQISVCGLNETMPVNRKAVVLLSGGLDSATTAAIARHDGFELYALSIDYGQRHRFELQAARRVGESLGVVRHVVAQVGLDQFGGSALTDEIEVPLDRDDRRSRRGFRSRMCRRETRVFVVALGYAEVVGPPTCFWRQRR